MSTALNILGCAVAVFGGFFITLLFFRKVTGNPTFRPIINLWGIFDFDIWLESFRLSNLLFYLVFGIVEFAVFALFHFVLGINLTEGIADAFRFILDLTLHLSGWD